MAKTACAPRSFIDSGSTALTVAWVPTAMNAGVRMSPCGVWITPTRPARPGQFGFDFEEIRGRRAHRCRFSHHARGADPRRSDGCRLLRSAGRPAAAGTLIVGTAQVTVNDADAAPDRRSGVEDFAQSHVTPCAAPHTAQDGSPILTGRNHKRSTGVKRGLLVAVGGTAIVIAGLSGCSSDNEVRTSSSSRARRARARALPLPPRRQAPQPRQPAAVPNSPSTAPTKRSTTPAMCATWATP